MEAKGKLRTSEDVYKRLTHAVQWDEDWMGEDDLWIGYQDGIFGPMEQRFSAFTPISLGGDLPFTRLWYFRRGDEACIAQACETLARLEEERREALAERQRRKLRQQRAKMQSLAQQPQQQQLVGRGDGPPFEPVPVVCIGGVAAPDRASLTLATWNAMFDKHIEEPELMSEARAPRLVASLVESAADIMALQEMTPDIVAAIDKLWPVKFWRVHIPGEELCIVSRYPIRNAISVSLGEHTCKKAILAEVMVHHKTVAVACVHLTSDRRGDHNVDHSSKREDQAIVVRDALATHMPHADAFVCGDFNEPNADGFEAAVGCMGGFVDAWRAAHSDGDGHPGYTFDPIRNELAALFALNRTPPRLDRIFAPAGWKVTTASLLGDVGAPPSDHFGVAATFELASDRSLAHTAEPVHTSALVILPPEACWAQIQRIRRQFDPSFTRWMPHINVLYGFVPQQYFEDAAVSIEAVLRRHAPMEIRLEKFVVFEHGRSASLVIVPECTPEGGIAALQHDLQAAFPRCLEQSKHELGYHPHVTLGKFDSTEEARHWKAELEQYWVPVTFTVQDLALIARAGETPFQTRVRVPLGSALKPQDLVLLEELEAKSGARAFAVGSAMLLGAERPPQSDLDVLLVGPRSREEVFAALTKSMPATWVRLADAHFPILAMEVHGVHLDIQYACSASLQHPLHWATHVCDGGGAASAALRDVHAIRNAVVEVHGVAGWQLYQRALLRVKKWAKARHVCSNALGYPGGLSWSLMLATTALAEQPGAVTNAEGGGGDGKALVQAMFQRFATWPWPRAVELLPSGAGKNAAGLMPVLCPTDVSANSTRNVTEATFRVIQAELQAAAAGAPPAHVLGGLQVFVRCQVRALGAELAVCSGWLEARLVTLVRSLDTLSPRPLKAAAGLWAIGISDPRSTALERVLEAFRARLARDVPAGSGWEDMIEVVVEDRDDFKLALAAAQSPCISAAATGGMRLPSDEVML